VTLSDNTKYAIIIESKCGTSARKNQLVDYYEKIKNHKDYEGYTIIPVYFKTGYFFGDKYLNEKKELGYEIPMDKNYEKIEKSLVILLGYNLCEILKNYIDKMDKKDKECNQILCDYYSYLCNKINNIKNSIENGKNGIVKETEHDTISLFEFLSAINNHLNNKTYYSWVKICGNENGKPNQQILFLSGCHEEESEKLKNIYLFYKVLHSKKDKKPKTYLILYFGKDYTEISNKNKIVEKLVEIFNYCFNKINDIEKYKPKDPLHGKSTNVNNNERIIGAFDLSIPDFKFKDFCDKIKEFHKNFITDTINYLEEIDKNIKF